MLSSKDQVVEILFSARLFERENSLHDNEKNHGEGEQIDLCTVVLFALLNLGSHIGHGATIAL